MRQVIFTCLLALSLAGCQSISVEQNPSGSKLPQGTISTMHEAFSPQIIEFVRGISIFHVDWIIDPFDQGYSGMYIPFTRSIIVSEESKNMSRTLVHEMLHVIFFKKAFPFAHCFEEDLERFVNDNRYQALIDYVDKRWSSYEDSWFYPSSFKADEYFCYLGEALYARQSYGDLGLPEYMARHYQGVLNPLLIYDHRRFVGGIRPDWDKVRAHFLIDGREVCVGSSMNRLLAFICYGGVLQPRDSMDGCYEIISMSSSDQPDLAKNQFRVEPGLEPRSISLKWNFSSDQLFAMRTYSQMVLIFERSGHEIAQSSVFFQRMVSHNTAYLSLNWNDVPSILESYLHNSLKVRIESSPMPYTLLPSSR